MDGLLSWTSLAAIGAAVILVGIGIWVLGRIRLTFRFRGAVTVSPWAQEPCPHLGLVDDPFIHRDEPNEEHRCYLYMQRDRIDMTHQKGFCLSSAHAHCPWLSIAPPEEAEREGGRLTSGVANASARAGAFILVWPAMQVMKAIPVVGLWSKKAWAYVAAQAARIAPSVAAKTAAAAAIAGHGAKVGAYGAYHGLKAATINVVHRIKSQRSAQAEAELPILQPDLPAVEASPVATAMDGAEATMPAPASVLSGSPLPTERGSLSHVDSFIEQGKAASAAGNRKLALSFFSMAVDLDRSNEEALLWKGAMAEDAAEKVACFQLVLAINPDNSRAQQAIRELQEPSKATQPAKTSRARGRRAASQSAVAGASATEEALLAAALEALEHGDEERAYRFCVSATEMSPQSEKAWFWRAKAAQTLDEVIFSLQQALTINPGNEKVKANLVWAIQRQQREEGIKKSEAEAAIKALESDEQDTPRWKLATAGFRWLAAVSCLALSAYWIMAAVLPLFSSPVLGGQGIDHPLYTFLNQWAPNLDWSTFPGYEKFQLVSSYNLLAAVPYTVGFLYLFVAIGIIRREKWSFYWGFVISILSLSMAGAFSTNVLAIILVTVLSVATVMTLLPSWSEFRRGAEQSLAYR